MAQQPLSAAIRRLELTAAGAALVPAARDVLASADAAAEGCDDSRTRDA